MQVNMHEAKSQLSKLIAAAEAGKLWSSRARASLRSGWCPFGAAGSASARWRTLPTPCRTLTRRWMRMNWRSGRAGVERGPAGHACMDLEPHGAGPSCIGASRLARIRRHV